MTNPNETPIPEHLDFDPEEAEWLWREAARVQNLHGELASLYRSGSTDRKTIRALWQHIEAGEYALRVAGVQL